MVRHQYIAVQRALRVGQCLALASADSSCNLLWLRSMIGDCDRAAQCAAAHHPNECVDAGA